MSASSSQYCNRSLPETSARLPAETNVENPIPRVTAYSRITSPSAAEWEKNPTLPRGARVGPRLALRRTSGLVFMKPRQLGPTSRTPCARTSSTRRCWRAIPSGPASVNPADMTTSPLAPRCTAFSATSCTASAGTVMMARSIASGRSASDG